MKTDMMMKSTLTAIAALLLNANCLFAQKTPMVVGDAVWGGWSLDNAAMMVQSAQNAKVFTYTGYLKANAEFKFLTECEWGKDEYRNANAADAYISGNGQLQVGGDDNKFKVAENANYIITLDLEQLTINVTKADYQTLPVYHNVLYLVGDATPGGWDLHAATPLAMDGSNPFLFKGIVNLQATGSFKIGVNPNAGYGQKFYFRDATDAAKVSEDDTDDRQWSVSSAGSYKVSVDLQQMTITLVDVTTGIATVNSLQQPSSPVYNLAGQRPDARFKGIGISNGRKYVVK